MSRLHIVNMIIAFGFSVLCNCSFYFSLQWVASATLTPSMRPERTLTAIADVFVGLHEGRKRPVTSLGSAAELFALL